LSSRRLEVGHVVKPHGLRGEVIVRLSTNRTERMAAGVVLDSDRGPMEILHASPHQGRFIVAFDGVPDRTAAEALRGLVLRAEPIDDEGAMWVHELIGVEVVGVDGRSYGIVESVEANPASDLLVLPGGGLVPLTFVVDRQPGRVVIDPPAGLLD
jgi:16S rRNA processing protein RimM